MHLFLLFALFLQFAAIGCRTGESKDDSSESKAIFDSNGQKIPDKDVVLGVMVFSIYL